MRFKNASQKLLAIVFLLVVAAYSLIGCAALKPSRSVDLGLDGKIAIFPVAVGVNSAAEGELDAVLFDLLKDTGQGALPSNEMHQILERDVETKALFENYYSLFNVLYFSDGKISAKIGERLGCRYFLIATVEEWGRIKEGKQEYAKVVIRLVLVDALTGKVLWRESRMDRQGWLFKQPSLKEIARGLAKDIMETKKGKV